MACVAQLRHLPRIALQLTQECKQRLRNPILLFRGQLPHLGNHLFKPLGHTESVPWTLNCGSGVVGTEHSDPIHGSEPGNLKPAHPAKSFDPSWRKRSACTESSKIMRLRTLVAVLRTR
jgi:hypothetical protein